MSVASLTRMRRVRLADLKNHPVHHRVLVGELKLVERLVEPVPGGKRHPVLRADG